MNVQTTARSEPAAVYQISPPAPVTQDDDAVITRALEILDGRLRVPGVGLSSPRDVFDYCKLRLAQKQHEVFMVLYLDNQHRLIDAREEFKGTLSQTSVYPREIAKNALELNAGAVILAHNHPSGLLEPSIADKRLTETLRALLGQLEIRVLDHVIVGRANSLSFAEKGLL
jgi:DNA repair protein RadC